MKYNEKFSRSMIDSSIDGMRSENIKIQRREYYQRRSKKRNNTTG